VLPVDRPEGVCVCVHGRGPERGAATRRGTKAEYGGCFECGSRRAVREVLSILLRLAKHALAASRLVTSDDGRKEGRVRGSGLLPLRRWKGFRGGDLTLP
jgi:hypothetical protein